MVRRGRRGGKDITRDQVGYISHRGNISGREPEKENSPDYLQEALSRGYHVECDVRFVKGENSLYLGHDKPQYPVPIDFFTQGGIWAHCKDVDSLRILHRERFANCFYHDKDAFTITSQGYIWCYPGNYVHDGIVVMPEYLPKDMDFSAATGVCSDFIHEWREGKWKII
jgi:hypothetical protein